MLNKELIRKLKEDPAFGEFMRDAFVQIMELDTVDGTEEMSNEDAGAEAKARSKAKRIVTTIFRPFLEFTERKEPTEAELKEAGARYGL